MALDLKVGYKHNPRSESWQVASVLNPSLQNSLPATQQSKHTREKREKSAEGPRLSSCPMCAGWQEEGSLPLPRQYVSPGTFCKAMPKYMRVKCRPDQMVHNSSPAVVTTTNSCCSLGNHCKNLPFSPRYDLAIGSPRSDHESAKLTPRSVPDSPEKTTDAAAAVVGSTSRKRMNTGAASPASPARNIGGPGSNSDTIVSQPHQNTPQTLATSHSPSASRRHSQTQSPRIRSAATSPMHPSSGGCMVGAARGGQHHQVMDASSLQKKLTSTIAQHPELQQRIVVPQMQSAAQGSPLSPANTSIGRENNPSGFQSHSTSQPVALPPTPPLQKRKTTVTRTSSAGILVSEASGGCPLAMLLPETWLTGFMMPSGIFTCDARASPAAMLLLETVLTGFMMPSGIFTCEARASPAPIRCDASSTPARHITSVSVL